MPGISLQWPCGTGNASIRRAASRPSRTPPARSTAGQGTWQPLMAEQLHREARRGPAHDATEAHTNAKAALPAIKTWPANRSPSWINVIVWIPERDPAQTKTSGQTATSRSSAEKPSGRRRMPGRDGMIRVSRTGRPHAGAICRAASPAIKQAISEAMRLSELRAQRHRRRTAEMSVCSKRPLQKTTNNRSSAARRSRQPMFLLHAASLAGAKRRQAR